MNMAQIKQAVSLLVLFSFAFTVKAQMSDIIKVCKTSPELCLAIPSDCLTNDTVPCIAAGAISSYNSTSERYQFSVATIPKNKYVALGFSTDRSMGGDVTVDCVNLSGTVRVSTATNSGYAHSRQDTENPNVSTVTLGVDAENQYCVFNIQTRLEVNNQNIQLVNGTSYYLLLASGDINAETGATVYHNTVKTISENKIVFGTE